MFSIRNIASNGIEDIKTITAICDAYCSPRTKFFECGERSPSIEDHQQQSQGL
jgi:hypothetical protein